MFEALRGSNKGTRFSSIWLISIHPSDLNSTITVFKKLFVIPTAFLNITTHNCHHHIVSFATYNHHYHPTARSIPAHIS